MSKKLTPAELACKIVGDGKRPNKLFVTIAFGWWMPAHTGDAPDMKQVKGSLEPVTMGPFTTKAAAQAVYDSVRLNCGTGDMTGQTIGEVMLEDRLTGTVKNKYLRRSFGGGWGIEEW